MGDCVKWIVWGFNFIVLQHNKIRWNLYEILNFIATGWAIGSQALRSILCSYPTVFNTSISEYFPDATYLSAQALMKSVFV